MEITKDRAILVGLELINSPHSLEESLNELEHLALAVDIKTVDKITQKTEKINPRYYIGSGKVLEIKKSIEVLNANIVIFDDPLSPAQIANLENALDCQIIDRSFLILSIFAKRAQSKQSILEVSLAQKEYMLPRLVGLGKSLSRQGGGSYNAKGPGETKLELDRRKLLNEISSIKKELKKISLEKETARKKRKQAKIPIVALVGYTNVGKSSLMNSLSKKLSPLDTSVFEKDILFATLDTKTKRMQKDNYPAFLLVDTVGFIRKLPHELVSSFESTLKDVIDADLLIIVADGAFFNPMQIESTLNVLTRLKANNIKKLFVFTKKEIALKPPLFFEDYLFISNVTGENIDSLINTIYQNLFENTKIVTLKIPFEKSVIFDHLKNTSTILKLEYLDDGYLIRVVLNEKDYEKFKDYRF